MPPGAARRSLSWLADGWRRPLLWPQQRKLPAWCLASGGRGLQCDRAGVTGALFQAALIQSAPRIAMSEEGVPAMFGRLVSPDLINAFATNRTKPNMNPPTTVPYITEAGT